MASPRTSVRPVPGAQPTVSGAAVSAFRGRQDAEVPPGSQQALGLRNRELVVESLLSAGPATQAMLARSTGLSAATVSNVVSRLRREGRVRTDFTVSTGRRAVLVQLQAVKFVAAGIEVSGDRMHAVLLRPGGDVLAGSSTPVSDPVTGADWSAVISGVLTLLLGRPEAEGSTLGAAGVALPALTGSGREQLPDCPDFLLPPEEDLQAVLGMGLGVPVTVASTAAMSAFAHASRLEGNSAALLFLNVGAEVTAGIVIGGQPYTGHAGLAGQLGHIRINDHGFPCRCGNRGCLNTVCSVPAMLAAYAAGRAPVTLQEFVVRAIAGDPAAQRIAEGAAEALGLAAAAAANIINPRHIILGGPLRPLGALLLDPFRRTLIREARPGIGDGAEVSLSTLGADVAAAGAALSAARHITTL
ncbi:MAG: hypothetical protein JWQ75_1235 [Pseudarthrobacter sp.]|nr:hypothetical protein [Pseudarthrobacter sp.]